MKASTDKRLAELANKIHTTDTTIDELDERLKSELSGLQNSIQEHRDATKLKFGETDKRHGAMISRCDDLKKDIQYVKEDLEYYKNNLTKADTGNSNSITSNQKRRWEGRQIYFRRHAQTNRGDEEIVHQQAARSANRADQRHSRFREKNVQQRQ